MSPLDAMGTYRHNDESAQMHSRAAGKEYPAKAKAGESSNMTEVHNHGDGTFHTLHDGQQEEHESIGHMHAHLSKLHGEDGHSHFHAHHDGQSHHSHSVKDGGEPDHREHGDDGGALHDHLSETMGEGERGPDVAEEEPAGKGLGELY